MKMRAILFVAILTYGCASNKTFTDKSVEESLTKTDDLKALDSVQAKKSSELTEDQRKALQNALSGMSGFCASKLREMESTANRRAKIGFWLSLTGAISGSVIAPALIAGNAAANSATIAAFSGFAGSTNFLSQSLSSSGLSGTSDASTRNAIVSNIWQKLTDAFDEQKTIGQRLSAIDAAKASCEFYSIHVPSTPSLPSGN